MPLKLWQMLLPQGLMLLPLCVILSYCWLMYCQIVADVIATCFVMWGLMLLPSGRWNNHYGVGVIWLADVITNWQVLLPKGYYVFSFSSGMLNRTSSHMCGRWYLPIFLFRDGLLTLIIRASLIALLRFWSSLPTMLKLSTLMLWPVLL